MNETRFEKKPRTKLKLSHIEREIRKHRIIVPCPSRQTLIGFCEDGTFEAILPSKQTGNSYLVYEDSFINWVRTMDDEI